MICIIDYDLGNVMSVKNAITKIGLECKISRNEKDISESKAIILPGVGSFEKGIKNLKKYDLIKILNYNVIQNKKKILGICLGFQLMCKFSEEFGKHEGLSWIDAEVTKINSQKLRLPHVGWNKIKILQNSSLLKEIADNERLYFNHSYCVKSKITNEFNIIAECDYGENFIAAIHKENIYGIQPHPEKSQSYGLKILKNFCN